MTKGRGSNSRNSKSAASSQASAAGNVVSIRSADHESVVAEAVGRAKECQGARADRFGRSSADVTFHFAGSKAVVRAHR